MIISNPYLKKQKWGTVFENNYHIYLKQKLNFNMQKRTPFTWVFSYENLKAAGEAVKNVLKSERFIYGTAGAATTAGIGYLASTPSDHINSFDQTLHNRYHGFYHPDRRIFEYYKALESGGFIRPQDRHMFIDHNGLLKAGHVKESYIDLIGDGSKPSSNVEFQEWKKQRMLEQKTYQGSLTPPNVLPPRMTSATASARDAIGGIPSLNEVATESKGIRPFTPAEAIRGVKKV
jgi:hypothetical protein